MAPVVYTISTFPERRNSRHWIINIPVRCSRHIPKDRFVLRVWPDNVPVSVRFRAEIGYLIGPQITSFWIRIFRVKFPFCRDLVSGKIDDVNKYGMICIFSESLIVLFWILQRYKIWWKCFFFIIRGDIHSEKWFFFFLNFTCIKLENMKAMLKNWPVILSKKVF